MRIPVDKKGAIIVAALTLSTLVGYARYRPDETGRRSAAGENARSEEAPAVPDVHAVAMPVQGPQSPVVTSTEDVSLSAKLDRSALLRGSDGELHVALTLRADTAEGAATQRQPTDAVVVLDISGSMNGQKLEFAKRALHELIDRLAPVDRFALVTYESTGNLLVPLSPADAAAIAGFHRVVDKLATAGGTNMSAGLDLAHRALLQRERAGRTARVILLSDGNANEGDSSLEGLRMRARRFVQHDDVLSAMGVGDDFNEDVMTSLADTGTGNFYYLSRVELLGRFFDAELRAAAQTVASALELRFTPPPGVQLVELAGYPIEVQGNDMVVRPGSLYAGQERVLWATLRAPTDALSDVAIGSFGLNFKKNEKPMAAPPLQLPALSCVADQQRFERAIAMPVWEEYVATEQYQKAQAALGRAIGTGSAADVEREQQAFESNRGLAEKLGSTRVLAQLAAMVSQADAAKASQNASPSERSFSAKQKKSRALFERRKDAYNDDPKLGL